MIRHVAFLRAVNVGDRSIVKMTEVQAAFAAAGCANVATFIASGNILFDATSNSSDTLRARIRGNVGCCLAASQ
jgi:uncharacterized protein (DUF1697 family)